MTQTPYVRTELAATQAGVPDPKVEVVCWIENLEYALASFDHEAASDSRVADGTRHEPTIFYDLIACWGRLRRTRPELLAALAGDEPLARADSIIGELGELVQQALGVPNPAAWLEEAQRLEDLAHGLVADREHQHVADLLADLDDAELVAAAACKFGVPDAELEAGLDRCREWLFDHLDLFLAASVTVQAIGLSLRPDLEEYDYDLAATAIKYEALLDEAVRAEADLTLVSVEPLPAEAVMELYEQFCTERARTIATVMTALAAAWLKHRKARRPLGRAADEEVPEGRVYEWRHTGTSCLARLVVPDPPPAGDDETLVLSFVTTDRRPDLSRGGQPVVLADVSRTIAENGHATFRLGELRSTGQPPRLAVGPALDEWELIAWPQTVVEGD